MKISSWRHFFLSTLYSPQRHFSQRAIRNPRFKKASGGDEEGIAVSKEEGGLNKSSLGGFRDANGFRIKYQERSSLNLLSSSSSSSPYPNPSQSNPAPNPSPFIPHYIIDPPLRRVEPYSFTYQTFCKQRWINRPLFSIFCSEFRDKPASYYSSAILSGQVRINGKVAASLDTLVKNGDKVEHTLVHKHEPPVSSAPVGIVHEDNEMVVIDKPSGIPVHPTGRYRYNSVVMILEHEMGIKAHPCNRLDRLTSGLMFLAKSSKAAHKFGQQLRDRRVQKEYVALVKGEFPIKEITVDKPLKTVAPKVSLNRVKHDGKPATTVFKRLSYDPETRLSLVKCRPLTGRTHQIRVHLQYIGHPIANDPVYSNVWVWGEGLGRGMELGKGVETEANEIDGNEVLEEVDEKEVIRKLEMIGHTVPAASYVNPFKFDENELQSKDFINTSTHDNASNSDPQSTTKQYFGEMLTGKQCPDCQTDLFSDPSSNDLSLWLHAFKYSSKPGSKILEEDSQLQNTFENSGSELGGVTGNQKSDQAGEANAQGEEIPAWSYSTPYPLWAQIPHYKFLKIAFEQAKQHAKKQANKQAHECNSSSTTNNLPITDNKLMKALEYVVGAVLVHNGKVLGTGYSTELGQSNDGGGATIANEEDATGKVTNGDAINENLIHSAVQSALQNYFAKNDAFSSSVPVAADANGKDVPCGTVLYTATLESSNNAFTNDILGKDTLLVKSLASNTLVCGEDLLKTLSKASISTWVIASSSEPLTPKPAAPKQDTLESSTFTENGEMENESLRKEQLENEKSEKENLMIEKLQGLGIEVIKLDQLSLLDEKF